MLKKFYAHFVLKYPLRVLAIVLIAVSCLGYFSTKLEIDASANTLLLENDKDLLFAREINKRYSNPNILIITYSPKEDLLSNQTILNISVLTKELEKLDQITSTTSILNVPLLQSPIKPIKELVKGVPTLEKSFVDKKLVKQEFLTSPLYENNLVSSDFKTTAILLNLKNDTKFSQLTQDKQLLLTKKENNSISKEEREKLKQIRSELKAHRDIQREIDSSTIEAVRTIIKAHQGEAQLFLGGVNMIANDVVSYVRGDLNIYGTTLLALFIVILWVFFGQIRWVVLPLFICLLSVVSTAGILGLFGWEVTVISSNFISLQLIITISIVLHLIVRYRELALKYTKSSQYKLVLNTVLSKAKPSLFAIITTIVGFASLILSDIQPVINLGWMMSFGIAISLFLAFLVFPALLILLKKKKPYTKFEHSFSIVQLCSLTVERHGKAIIIGSVVVLIFSFTGASKLIVENSFINYFKKNTEIYKGMKVIDENLGGTTPLDVILTFNDTKETEVKINETITSTQEDDDFDSFEDEFEESSNDAQYWFTPDKMEIIMKTHDYLESIPEIGKVQSFGTLLKIGQILNKNKDLDNFQLALLYNKLPEEFKEFILKPYINIEANQVRFTVRIVDSNEDLRRNELILKLNKELKDVINPDMGTYRLSNLMVLYNNMLQSLFDSQILTLGIVAVVLFIMFLILFRSTKIAFVAIIANIIPISVIFGVMGWLGIPLDIMTITIAAISIGIGVDDTIHYIHRYQEEFHFDKDYIKAMQRAHGSIGYAMFYTSFVITTGFSVLILSNFIPTIYFGLLTMLVMVVVLLADLLLLPKLIIMLKPFEKQAKHITH